MDPKWLQFMRHIVEEFKNANDRTVAIVGAALLEDSLKQAILSRLRKPPDANASAPTRSEYTKVLDELFAVNRPLGSFSARYLLGYVIHIWGWKTFSDLRRIGKIRNEFAHHPLAIDNDGNPEPLTFEHAPIRDRAKALSLSERHFVVWHRGAPEVAEFINAIPKEKTPKMKFIASVMYIEYGLKQIIDNPLSVTDGILP